MGFARGALVVSMLMLDFPPQRIGVSLVGGVTTLPRSVKLQVEGQIPTGKPHGRNIASERLKLLQARIRFQELKAKARETKARERKVKVKVMVRVKAQRVKRASGVLKAYAGLM